MKKEQFLAEIEKQGPTMVGRFMTGRLEAGKRVDPEKGGATESFCSIVSVLVCGRKGFEVKTNLKGETLKGALLAVGDETKEAAFMPAQAGEECFVVISSIRNEKGRLSISGAVHPFGQSNVVATKKG